MSEQTVKETEFKSAQVLSVMTQSIYTRTTNPQVNCEWKGLPAAQDKKKRKHFGGTKSDISHT